MIWSTGNFFKDVSFSLKPSARELTELDFQCFDSTWSEKDYFEMKKNPFFYGWILGIPGKYNVGILAFNIIYQELEILRLGVHPFWRKKGIAKLMLNRLDLLARNKKVISIFLEVHFANNPALSLYSKSGFHPVGRRKNYFKNPFGDAILLKKNIKTILE
tara:strand:+ start:774 stop:1253 length:480 start_codon:yes stop_codon:yes gene_type:complete